MKKQITLICPHCKYEWEPKIKKPKSCPLCKQYARGDNKFKVREPKAAMSDVVN